MTSLSTQLLMLGITEKVGRSLQF